MLRSLIRKLVGKEAGQALPLFGLFLFVLFGFVAMSIDVGRYVWARTQMQAAVDSAALAAAQSMPSLSDANAKAEAYWLDNSGFIRSQGENVQFNVEYPEGNKAIRVSGSADIPTYFARLFGVDEWHVSASGDAESQVLDIAVVLDVSGSMCYSAPGVLHSESTESYLMSAGHPASRPTVADQNPATPALDGIPSGGIDSITIRVSNVAIFNSTNSSTNSTNFGYSSGDRYYNRTMGRAGMVAIFQNSGPGVGAYELFKITAVDSTNNTLTVTRAQNILWRGTFPTSKITHAVGAEIWANRSGCDRAARNTTSPYGIDPFDDTIINAEYFTTLFDPSYDKIGVVRYSETASSVRALSSDLASIRTSIHNLVPPTGATNIPHGLAKGRQIVFDGSTARTNGVKVIVLLTDGIPNRFCTNPSAYATSGFTSCAVDSSESSPTSCTPETAAMTHLWAQATAAKNAGITVYVIGLGAGVLDCVLEKTAANGGGKYYKAPTTAQLDEAFQAIAEQTHIALVK